jgi:hypothetical protein
VGICQRGEQQQITYHIRIGRRDGVSATSVRIIVGTQAKLRLLGRRTKVASTATASALLYDKSTNKTIIRRPRGQVREKEFQRKNHIRDQEHGPERLIVHY